MKEANKAIEKALKAKNILEHLFPLSNPEEDDEASPEELVQMITERASGALFFVNALITDLAALESEKPTGDAEQAECDIFMMIAHAKLNGTHCILRNYLQQFAESYHEQRMKEAQAIIDAEPHGMIASGMPGPMSLNAQLKRCEAYHTKECAQCKKDRSCPKCGNWMGGKGTEACIHCHNYSNWTLKADDRPNSIIQMSSCTNLDGGPCHARNGTLCMNGVQCTPINPTGLPDAENQPIPEESK